VAGGGIPFSQPKDVDIMLIRHPTSRSLHYEVPEDAPWPPLQKALDRYRTLQEATSAAHGKLESAQAAIRTAAAEDAAVHARAIYEGKKPSGADKEASVRAQAEEAERDLAASRAAVALAFDQIVRVVEEHRAEWLAANIEAEQEALRERAAAVAAFDASVAALATIRNRGLFLQKFPQNSVKKLPPRRVTIDGRSIPFANVRQALEQDTATLAPMVQVARAMQSEAAAA
jgi:hypothetical protein